MKVATILSNFEGITSKRFFDEYIYQIMVVRDIIKYNRLDIFPVSIDTVYEQAFNSYDKGEKLNFHKKAKDIHRSSSCILVCIDRGLTDEMQSIIEHAIQQNNCEVIFYTIYPDDEAIGKIIKTINNDTISSLKKLEIVKTFCRKLEKNNALIYKQIGDATNYRANFFKSIAFTENEALLTFAAALEQKLERDAIGGKKTIQENPFEVLKNVRQQVEDRKAS